MGVPVQRVQFLMFVQVGIASALAGLMLSSKLAAATPITGQGLEINALTVVLLGGVAFAGGIGRISGVVAGLFFVGVLRNGLVVTDTSQFLQQVLIGVTLIAAVAIDDTFRQTMFGTSSCRHEGAETASASRQSSRVALRRRAMAMTSDSGRGMTVAERDAFLTSGTIFAKIATTIADGWPVVSPVWFEWLAQDRAFLVISKARTSMVQNLRRDPRCGVLVDNPGLPYMRVSVLGEAEFLPEDFDWITPARKMAERYLGAPGVAYAETTFGFPREPFLVHARKMTTWNGGGFDRTFSRPTTWHDMTAPQPPKSPSP